MTPFIDNTVFDYNWGDTDAGDRLIDSQYASDTLYVDTTANGGDGTMFGVNFADGRIKGYGLTIGDGAEAPKLELPNPQQHKSCVAETEYMRSSHMDLLDDWRTVVVRDGVRVYKGHDGVEHDISLSQTCLGCHENKEAFCDRCHDYVGVEPYCFDCHNVPEGGK